MEDNMLPLGLLGTGEKAEVMEVSAERRLLPVKMGMEQVDVRIEDIGIRTGKVIEMLNNKGRGPLLLKVDESRIAIARGLAMKIMVRRKG
jgi:ferrous iron transport protein A